jgi:hypothetical protein
MEHYKTWNNTDSFIHLDFCISVTIKMNLRRQKENKTNCEKEKLKDLYAKYYSPTGRLAVDEILVLFKFSITIMCLRK